MAGQIQKPDKAEAALASGLEKLAPQIEKSLARQFDVDAFTRMVLTAAKINTTLLQCSPRSFWACVIQAAQLRLPPDPTLGWAWIVPRRIKGEWTAQFQLGYRGAVQLMYRSGNVSAVRSNIVREGERFVWEDGLQPRLIHEPMGDPDAAIMGAWAAIDTTQGGHIPLVLSIAELERIKRRSDAAVKGFGPWTDPADREWMMRKSAIVRLWKTAPSSVEVQRAFVLDEMADAGVDQQLDRSIDVDFSVVNGGEPEQESKSAAERFKQQHGGGEAEDGQGGEPALLSKEAVARIRKHAKSLKVDEEKLAPVLDKIAGTGNLEEVPAEHEETIVKAIDQIARRQK